MNKFFEFLQTIDAFQGDSIDLEITPFTGVRFFYGEVNQAINVILLDVKRVAMKIQVR
jgi:hypothetical protein